MRFEDSKGFERIINRSAVADEFHGTDGTDGIIRVQLENPYRIHRIDRINRTNRSLPAKASIRATPSHTFHTFHTSHTSSLSHYDPLPSLANVRSRSGSVNMLNRPHDCVYRLFLPAIHPFHPLHSVHLVASHKPHGRRKAKALD